jgi:DNA invertase Pin-like site-specific DNA recombinase
MKKKQKAYGYIRVSGKGQISKDGPKRQERAIKKYTKENKIELIKIFTEKGISGTTEDRPALAEMMLSLEKNGQGVDTIIIEKIDRLARDLMVQEAIIRDIKKDGLQLISVMEGNELLEEDPTRILIRQVFGAVSQYEKQMIVLKLRAARERMRAKGLKCEGRSGYADKSAGILKEVKKLRRKRKGLPPLTHTKIAEILNERGVKTHMGKEFTAINVNRILNMKRKKRRVT